MRKCNSCHRKTVVSLSPLDSSLNRYVSLFSKAIADQKYAIREFRWRPTILWRTNVVILHWPNEFFTTDGKSATIKSLIKIALIWLSRYLWHIPFIWVAHNAAPHDTKKSVRWLTRWFLRSMDGIIFLSAYSRDLIGALYPESRGRNSLVTVHGHYRDAAVTPLTTRPIPTGDVKLAYIGQVRPYKNLEVLVDAATRVSREKEVGWSPPPGTSTPICLSPAGTSSPPATSRLLPLAVCASAAPVPEHTAGPISRQ
jgi:beta-1,4-mannosyltransferase